MKTDIQKLEDLWQWFVDQGVNIVNSHVVLGKRIGYYASESREELKGYYSFKVDEVEITHKNHDIIEIEYPSRNIADFNINTFIKTWKRLAKAGIEKGEIKIKR